MKIEVQDMVLLKRFIRLRALENCPLENAASMSKVKNAVDSYIHQNFRCYKQEVSFQGTILTVQLDGAGDSHKYVFDAAEYNKIFDFEAYVDERLKSF